MERESDIVKSIKDYLEWKKYLFIRNNSGAMKTERGGFIRFGSVGSPDFVVFLQGGKAIGLEVKTAKGVLSEGQKIWQAKAKELKMKYEVVRSLDELQKIGL